MTDVKFNFSGKRALVTGAGRGIGRALAIALAGAGAETFALSKTVENLQSLSKVNSSIHPVCVDLMDWDATRKAIADVGCIDLLVNNAGIASLQSFLEVDKDSLDELFEVNVKAVVNISQVVAKGMIDRASPGSIVNVSSQASSRALKDHTVYCSTKGALDQLTRMMALELGPHKIRVNSVNPTVVLTDMGKFVWSDEAKGGPMKARIPLGRFAEESDVVDAIMFLLSDSASMIHGAFLPIDGGFLVT